MPMSSRESVTKWGRLEEMKNRHLKSLGRIWSSHGRSRRKQRAKRTTLQRQMLKCQGGATLRSLGAASPTGFSRLKSEQRYPPATSTLQMAKGAYGQLMYRITVSQSRPWAMQLGCQLSDGPGGLDVAISPVERGTFRLSRWCWQIVSISWVSPIEGQWLPGTLCCSLAPWLTSEVSYGQRMEVSSIHTTYLNLYTR